MGISRKSDQDNLKMPFIEFIIGHTVENDRVSDATGDNDAECWDG
jgi:hypothetical protein